MPGTNSEPEVVSMRDHMLTQVPRIKAAAPFLPNREANLPAFSLHVSANDEAYGQKYPLLKTLNLRLSAMFCLYSPPFLSDTVMQYKLGLAVRVGVNLFKPVSNRLIAQ